MAITYEKSRAVFKEYLLNCVSMYTFCLTITERCNLECAMCAYACSRDYKPPMSHELADKCIEEAYKLSKDNWICLFGGEPMLEPELCAYIAQKAHSKGLKVSLCTSGFWGKSKKHLDMMENEIKPDYLWLSIDDYHNVPDDVLFNIFERFKDKFVLLISTLTGSTKQLKFAKKYSNVYVETTPPYDIGRFGKFLKKEDNCRRAGWNIYPDGEVRCECMHGKEACLLGNIMTDNIDFKLSIPKLCLSFDHTNLCQHIEGFNYFSGKYDYPGVTAMPVEYVMEKYLNENQYHSWLEGIYGATTCFD